LLIGLNWGGLVINTLYVVGNGFDIAHGLNTNYWGLRNYIEQQDPDFMRFFEGLYNIQPLDDTEPWYTERAQKRWDESVNHSLWSEFEKTMGMPNTEEMLELSVSVTEGMPNVGVKYHMDLYWKDHFGFVSRLQNYVREWIELIDTSTTKCKVSSLLNSDDIFLNFNYTDVLENVYNIEKVCHIHGGVKSICKISPMLGHCNKKDIQKHRQWAKEAEKEFAETEASIQDAVANYLEEIYKDTSQQIFVNKQFFDKLKSIEHIIIIGWSAGEADIPYLQEIIRKVDPKTKWTVYWYDDVAYKALTAAFNQEGITDKNIIEYKNSGEFWINKHV
jgi:hypothetical protein